MYTIIEAELKKQGKTFADLARETGIPNSTFSQMKKQGYNLSFANAMKVSTALGIKIEDLSGKGEE